MPHADTITHHMRAREWSPSRLYIGLTDAGLAVSRQSLYNWLSGSSCPAPEAWAVLIVVLGIPDHEIAAIARARKPSPS